MTPLSKLVEARLAFADLDECERMFKGGLRSRGMFKRLVQHQRDTASLDKALVAVVAAAAGARNKFAPLKETAKYVSALDAALAQLARECGGGQMSQPTCPLCEGPHLRAQCPSAHSPTLGELFPKSLEPAPTPECEDCGRAYGHERDCVNSPLKPAPIQRCTMPLPCKFQEPQPAPPFHETWPNCPTCGKDLRPASERPADARDEAAFAYADNHANADSAIRAIAEHFAAGWDAAMAARGGKDAKGEIQAQANIETPAGRRKDGI